MLATPQLAVGFQKANIRETHRAKIKTYKSRLKFKEGNELIFTIVKNNAETANTQIVS